MVSDTSTEPAPGARKMVAELAATWARGSMETTTPGALPRKESSRPPHRIPQGSGNGALGFGRGDPRVRIISVYTQGPRGSELRCLDQAGSLRVRKKLVGQDISALKTEKQPPKGSFWEPRIILKPRKEQ